MSLLRPQLRGKVLFDPKLSYALQELQNLPNIVV